jgi:hypothetical protein
VQTINTCNFIYRQTSSNAPFPEANREYLLIDK